MALPDVSDEMVFRAMSDETPEQKCWICGNLADSREHKVKRSHLKVVFGDFTEENKVHYRSAQEKLFIHRLDHFLVLFQKVICQDCNNRRTQESDKAWERLVKYFHTQCWEAKKGDFLKLRQPFPNKTAVTMLKVHLYFVKLLGCAIAEQGIPIPLQSFSDAIMNGEPHSSIYLTFSVVADVDIKKLTGVTEILYDNNGASWTYCALPISVNITYDPTHTRHAAVAGWHPRLLSDKVCLDAI